MRRGKRTIYFRVALSKHRNMTIDDLRIARDQGEQFKCVPLIASGEPAWQADG